MRRIILTLGIVAGAGVVFFASGGIGMVRSVAAALNGPAPVVSVETLAK